MYVCMQGHFAKDCFSKPGLQYSLVPEEEEEPPTSNQNTQSEPQKRKKVRTHPWHSNDCTRWHAGCKRLCNLAHLLPNSAILHPSFICMLMMPFYMQEKKAKKEKKKKKEKKRDSSSSDSGAEDAKRPKHSHTHSDKKKKHKKHKHKAK